MGLVLALVPGVRGQATFDIQLPPTMPAVFEGPAFSTSNALAVSGGQAIHLWAGLPQVGSYQMVPLSGVLAMSSPWRRLSASTAIYRSVGSDLVPGNVDDVLILVIGLPYSPVLVPTAVAGLDPDYLPVNPTTAVRLQASGFQVLRYDGTGGNEAYVHAGQMLCSGPKYQWKAISDDAIAGLGVGSDQVPGTADDKILVLSGLRGSLWSLATWALPSGAAPQGLSFSGSGVPVLWEPAGLPTVRLTVVRMLPSAPWFVTFLATPAANIGPSFIPACGVEGGPGDSVVPWCTDDFGPGTGRALVTSLATGAPAQVASWYDDLNCGCGSTVVDDQEVGFFSAMWPSGFSYSIYGPVPFSFSRQLPWTNEVIFRKPNANSLFVATNTFGGAQAVALATAFVDLGPGQREVTTAAPGRWAGGGLGLGGTWWAPRIEAVGAGMVAGFLAPSGSWASAPTVLRVTTMPSAVDVRPGVSGGPTLVDVSVALPSGTPATPIVFSVAVPPYWQGAEGWIVVSAGLAGTPFALPTPLFAPGGQVQIDLQAFLAVLPFTFASGHAQISINANPLQPTLVGRPLYFQVLAHDGFSAYHVSDAFLLVVF